MKRYALNIAIGLDQLANAVLAGHPDETLSSRSYRADQAVNALLAGAPDETLSSRAHRMRLKGHRYWGWTATAINWLFFWEADHCRAAYESELRRTQLPHSFK